MESILLIYTKTVYTISTVGTAGKLLVIYVQTLCYYNPLAPAIGKINTMTQLSWFWLLFHHPVASSAS